jgi:hypothetical protein
LIEKNPQGAPRQLVSPPLAGGDKGEGDLRLLDRLSGAFLRVSLDISTILLLPPTFCSRFPCKGLTPS